MPAESREKLLEALLFESGEGYSVSKLSQILGCDLDETEEALADLAHSLTSANRGIRLLRQGDRAQLVTCSEVSSTLQKARKESLSGSLSPAALETLTVILYLGPVAKQTVDYIRGVNSRGILRTLRARDLIEPVQQEGVVHYVGTVSVLRYLGVEKQSDLPDYESVRKRFKETLENNTDDHEQATA